MRRIVAIGAHFDDIELGCGGSLLRFKKYEYDLDIIVVTNSGYSHYSGSVIRSNGEAFAEGKDACEAIGAKLWCLNRKTKNVKCDHVLVEDIECILDQISPDIIFSHWLGDLHEDHYEVARASLLAARHYPSVLLYRSNWYHSDKEFKGRFYIDISHEMEEKIEILKMHKSEYKRKGGPWLDFVRSRAREAGLRMNVMYAEEFEIAKFLLK